MAGRGLKCGLLAAGVLLALAACHPRHPTTPPQPVAPLRNPAAQISSAVIFDPARFAGDWHVVASGVPGCAGGTQRWRWDGRDRYAVSGTDCGAGDRPAALSGTLVKTGTDARFSPDTGFGGKRVWVLWFDQDYRIAVLGNREGSFATVLSRTDPPREDLMRAARQVLDFNGYDLRRIGR